MGRLSNIGLAGLILLMVGCKSYEYATVSPEQTQPQPEVCHTVYVPAARASVTMDRDSYTARVAFSTTKDSLVIWSIQLVPGMELFRVETTPNEVLVFDKTTMTCVPLSYTELSTYVSPAITFDDLQAIATGEILPLGRTKTLRSYTGLGKTVILELEYPQIWCNVPVNMNRLSPLRFESKTLETLME